MPKELFHQNELLVFNTLSRQKEKFIPLHEPFVGMYVCGPTVYNEPHLGNCRTYVSYDMIYRYLQHLGYRVRYVRNITDAGHIESTSGEVSDRIAEQAKLEQLEPMEIAQKYSIKFHEILRILNCLPPSIEPRATGHMIEQIEMTRRIIENGYAYETDKAVYFDVDKFSKDYPYTQLSGRKLDELLNNTRELDGQEAKRGKFDFALMVKADPSHIMRWPSPWGDVYPGWHIECSAMSEKYLGKTFDIHGGGMDLIPTHHTNEIAQSVAGNKCVPVKYWMHTNMLTVNGKKMSKSLGNAFLPEELFAGTHPLLDQGYSPMTVRFSMLQAHYRSTMDFSNEALKAAEKGYKRMITAAELLQHITVSGIADKESEKTVNRIIVAVYEAMNNDFNTAQAIAELNEAASLIYTWKDKKDGLADITEDDLQRLKSLFNNFLFDIFGLQKTENDADADNEKVLDGVMDLVIDIRKDARTKKDFSTSDKVRDALQAIGIQLNDGKEGTTWGKKLTTTLIVKNGFNDVAFAYDALFTESEICKCQREIVWQYLRETLSPHQSILETNCGTGEDAVFLAKQGHHITATDGAPNMVDIAEKKCKENNIADAEVFLWDLNTKYPGTVREFDATYSNFGGWNCLSPEGIKNAGNELAQLIKPGGKLIVILITKFCWWETFYFLLKFNLKQAFRRFKNKPVHASLTPDAFIDTWYHSTADMKQYLQPHFMLKRKLPAGFFTPPSYLEVFFARHKRFLQTLFRLDMRTRKFSFLTFGADQYILEFERI